MKNKHLKRHRCGDLMIGSLLIVLSLALGGCASNSLVSSQEQAEVVELTPMPPLTYYMMLSRMTPAELGRERMVLTALPHGPNTQVRMAMLYGYSRTQQDLSRAISLLDGVLKAKEPAAIALQPLARLLADNYAERQRLDGHLDRQATQLKESQRKAVELQEKIDSLADIERTLPQRPRAARPVQSGKVK